MDKPWGHYIRWNKSQNDKYSIFSFIWASRSSQNHKIRVESWFPGTRRRGNGELVINGVKFQLSKINKLCVVLCSVAQSCPTLCDPVTVALQVLCPWGFSRQEYWSGLPCPPLGNLPNLGIQPTGLPHCKQIGLACCDSWGRKESDTTEQLNWKIIQRVDLMLCYYHNKIKI